MKKNHTTIRNCISKNIKWKKEIGIGDIFTGIAILIAFGAFIYQKKDVNARINTIEEIIYKINNEKNIRQNADSVAIVNFDSQRYLQLELDLVQDLKTLESSIHNDFFTVSQNMFLTNFIKKTSLKLAFRIKNELDTMNTMSSKLNENIEQRILLVDKFCDTEKRYRNKNCYLDKHKLYMFSRSLDTLAVISDSLNRERFKIIEQFVLQHLNSVEKAFMYKSINKK